MHWRSHYLPNNGEIADADSLMEGFGDAVGAVWGGIDQNDIEAAKVLSTRFRTPLNDDGITFAANSAGALAIDSLSVAQTLPMPIRQTTGDADLGELNQEWVFVEKTAGNSLTVTIAPLTTAPWRITAQGQYLAATTATSPRILRLDARILLDGTPLDAVASQSSQVDGGWLSWLIEADIDVTPGTHTIRMQVRDRSEDASVAGTVEAATIFAVGDVR